MRSARIGGGDLKLPALFAGGGPIGADGTARYGLLLIADHHFISDRAVAVEMVDDRPF
jgi:hypothetical protein